MQRSSDESTALEPVLKPRKNWGRRTGGIVEPAAPLRAYLASSLSPPWICGYSRAVRGAQVKLVLRR